MTISSPQFGGMKRVTYTVYIYAETKCFERTQYKKPYSTEEEHLIHIGQCVLVKYRVILTVRAKDIQNKRVKKE
ncbi:hypothetical protein ACJX0J_025684, partial [Zea mays]